MTTIPPALESAILPQYLESAAFMERFLDAIHSAGADIARSQNTKRIKLVDGSEIRADCFDYFSEHKAEMEAEFLSDLTDQVGKEKAEWFCDVIAKDWYDGRGLRTGKRVIDLKSSIRAYLEEVGISPALVVQHSDLPQLTHELPAGDIAAILTVNDRMMIRHIEAWKAVHPNSDRMSNDEIYLRRGLSLDNPLEETASYKEWDYINSYSIALSAPEQFSQMQAGKIPALVHGDIALFDGRILFFSPFIPNMKIGQLEAGVIPNGRPQTIKAQGKHGGILEYILDPID